MAEYKLSEGARQFAVACAPPASVSALAQALEVSRTALYPWRDGKSVPPLGILVKIERLLGIPLRDWTKDAEPADESETPTPKPDAA